MVRDDAGTRQAMMTIKVMSTKFVAPIDQTVERNERSQRKTRAESGSIDAFN
jgi:hypothetical protein